MNWSQKKRILVVLMILYVLIIIIGIVLMVAPKPENKNSEMIDKREKVKLSIKEDATRRIDRILGSIE